MGADTSTTASCRAPGVTIRETGNAEKGQLQRALTSRGRKGPPSVKGQGGRLQENRRRKPNIIEKKPSGRLVKKGNMCKKKQGGESQDYPPISHR